MDGNKSNNSGCLALIGIIGIILLIVNTCGDKGTKTSTKKTVEKEQISQSAYQQQSAIDYTEREELSEEDKQFVNNSLSTGATPYKAFYGKNYKCPYDRCSGIEVTAPAESDIVVIIKRNNQNGKVVAHGYIRAGATYQFAIPDGTFQTFFYYGEGWNPNKDMGNGVKGGFVKDEIFSKDNPQDIYSAILTYVLQLQRDGNFQTKGSSRGEFF